MDEKIAQARDLLVDWAEHHRQHCTDKDCAEVGNILGFLAHSMGAGPQDVKVFPKWLAYYDIECEGCGSLRDAAAAALKG